MASPKNTPPLTKSPLHKRKQLDDVLSMSPPKLSPFLQAPSVNSITMRSPLVPSPVMAPPPSSPVVIPEEILAKVKMSKQRGNKIVYGICITLVCIVVAVAAAGYYTMHQAPAKIIKETIGMHNMRFTIFTVGLTVGCTILIGAVLYKRAQI